MKLRRRLALLIDPSLRRDLDARIVRAGDVITTPDGTPVRVARIEYVAVTPRFGL